MMQKTSGTVTKEGDKVQSSQARELSRTSRRWPTRVTGVAFLFTLSWMAVAGLWLLYGEPVWGEGRTDILPSELGASAGLSDVAEHDRSTFAHVRVSDVTDAAAFDMAALLVEGEEATAEADERAASDIDGLAQDGMNEPAATEAEAPEPERERFVVAIGAGSYVGVQLSPIWGGLSAEQASFLVTSINPQSALREHLCVGDLVLSQDWMHNAAVTGEAATRALETAIYLDTRVELTIQPAGAERDTQVDVVIVNTGGDDRAAESSRDSSGFACLNDDLSPDVGSLALHIGPSF